MSESRWYKGRPGRGRTTSIAVANDVLLPPLEVKSGGASGSLQYLASQYLQNSSLASAFTSGVAGAGDAAFDDMQQEESRLELNMGMENDISSDKKINSESISDTKLALSTTD